MPGLFSITVYAVLPGDYYSRLATNQNSCPSCKMWSTGLSPWCPGRNMARIWIGSWKWNHPASTNTSQNTSKPATQDVIRAVRLDTRHISIHSIWRGLHRPSSRERCEKWLLCAWNDLTLSVSVSNGRQLFLVKDRAILTEKYWVVTGEDRRWDFIQPVAKNETLRLKGIVNFKTPFPPWPMTPKQSHLSP